MFKRQRYSICAIFQARVLDLSEVWNCRAYRTSPWNAKDQYCSCLRSCDNVFLWFTRLSCSLLYRGWSPAVYSSTSLELTNCERWTVLMFCWQSRWNFLDVRDVRNAPFLVHYSTIMQKKLSNKSERSETHHFQSNMFKMHFWPVLAKLSSLNSSNVSNILIWADIFNFTENFRKHEKQTSRVGHEVSLFPRLVLGGINTDSCNQIFILQNFQDLQNHLLANI